MFLKKVKVLKKPFRKWKCEKVVDTGGGINRQPFLISNDDTTKKFSLLHSSPFKNGDIAKKFSSVLFFLVHTLVRMFSANKKVEQENMLTMKTTNMMILIMMMKMMAKIIHAGAWWAEPITSSCIIEENMFR